MKNLLSNLIIALSLMISLNGNCQSENRLIQQGNDQYKNSKFPDAEKNYKKSIEKQPLSFTGNYNLGNALYKQKKYEDAAKQFMQAAGVDSTTGNQSKSYYNLGNSLLKSDKYKESTEAYKMALRQNPSDENARYNLSYALSKLHQQEQQNKENKDNKNKDKKDNKDQKNKDQQQKNKDQQQKDQQQKDQQKEQQKKDQEKQDQQAKQQQSKPKISKEDAERILEALKNDEKDLQKKKAKKYEATGNNPAKDW